MFVGLFLFGALGRVVRWKAQGPLGGAMYGRKVWGRQHVWMTEGGSVCLCPCPCPSAAVLGECGSGASVDLGAGSCCCVLAKDTGLTTLSYK